MLPHSLVEFSVCIEEVIVTQSEVVVITLETIKDRITEILISVITLVIGEILKIINCDKVPLSLPNKMCDTDQNLITEKTVNTTMEKLNNKELSLSLKKDIKQVTENSLNGAASGPKPRNHNTNPDKRHYRKSNLIIGTSKNENKTESDSFMVASQKPRYYNLHLTRVDPSVPVEKFLHTSRPTLRPRLTKKLE
ncbi:hypothetical protein Zmor_024408 [Zophobas morio]|uniref:Uncharacterized protein n=1 Tax=Zophobas morio TaxID=2755281 RepID=A0AA38M883_9CUCU|nr:hypothetical protein Zmor_024408 [Zophobas morio]